MKWLGVVHGGVVWVAVVMHMMLLKCSIVGKIWCCVWCWDFIWLCGRRIREVHPEEGGLYVVGRVGIIYYRVRQQVHTDIVDMAE